MASTFYVKIQGKQLGPIGVTELKKLATDGGLSQNDFVSRDGREWSLARTVKGLEFPTSRVPDPPPAPSNGESKIIRPAPEFDPSELLGDIPAHAATAEMPMPSFPALPMSSPERSLLNLTACPDCRELISLKATACPHCGCPIVAPGHTDNQPPVKSTHAISSGQGTTIIVLLCIALGFPFLSWLRPVPKWEYHIASPSDLSLRESIDDLGAKGWEIVSARRATSSYGDPSYEIIFKRPKTAPF